MMSKSNCSRGFDRGYGMGYDKGKTGSQKNFSGAVGKVLAMVASAVAGLAVAAATSTAGTNKRKEQLENDVRSGGLKNK